MAALNRATTEREDALHSELTAAEIMDRYNRLFRDPPDLPQFEGVTCPKEALRIYNRLFGP